MESDELVFAPQKTLRWHQVILLTLSSALLSALSHPPCNIAYLAWVSLVPMFYSLPYQSLRQTFVTHAAYVSCFFGIGISWMGKVHPVCPFVILIPLYFICLPFPLIFRWVVRRREVSLFIAAPVIWCANDYFRSFIITGFPWLYPGHTQAFFPILIQIADITGVYGVTFAVVLVNALLASWLEWLLLRSRSQLRYNAAYTVATALFMSLILTYGSHRLRTVSWEYGPKVIAIQGNIPQDIKDDQTQNRKRVSEVYDRLTFEAIQEHPDAELLVWPETMCIGDPMANPSDLLKFEDIARYCQMHLLIGAHHYEISEDGTEALMFNSGYFMNPQGEFVERYDKIHLVIIGEYTPFEDIFPFLPNIVRRIAGYVPTLSEGKRRPVFTLGTHHFGTLICYDIVYAEDARDLRRKGCNFLINITNEGWFDNTCELEQILAISIFRAVENRIGIVRAGNTGITGNIPPSGELLSEELLTIPSEDYLASVRKYTPFLADRIAGKRAIAWHHFPQSISTDLAQDWDVVLGNKRVKWKDFPGIFCRKVPLATKEEPLYTKIGDLFAWILSAITLLLAGRPFVKAFLSSKFFRKKVTN